MHFRHISIKLFALKHQRVDYYMSIKLLRGSDGTKRAQIPGGGSSLLPLTLRAYDIVHMKRNNRHSRG